MATLTDMVLATSAQHFGPSALHVGGTMNDGGQVWPADGSQGDPVFSPDGRWIAYSDKGSDLGAHARIMLRRADGLGTARLVAQDPIHDLTQPAWSPNGQWLAYTVSGINPTWFSISVAAVFTGTVTPLPNGSGLLDPTWLDDGRLVTVVDGSAQEPLSVVAYPSGARSAIPGTEGAREPVASHDGQRVAYVLPTPVPNGFQWSVRTTTTSGHQVALRGPVDTTISSPRWEPGDRRLIWIEDPTSPTEQSLLAGANANGSDYQTWEPGVRWTGRLGIRGLDIRSPDIIGSTDFTNDPTPLGSGSHGSNDLLAVDASGVLWLYPSLGDLAPSASGSYFAARRRIGGGWSTMRSILAPGDITSDGRPDLLAIDAGYHLLLYPGTGAGSFAAPRTIGSGWRFASVSTGGDIDGDLHPDLLAQDSTGHLWLYPTTGSDGVAAAVFLPRKPLGGGWTQFDALTVPGDFDNLGHPDLVARDSAGQLWLWPGQGTGLGARRRIGQGWGGVHTLLGVGQFASGRTGDLIAVDASGVMRLYLNFPFGTVGPPTAISKGWNAMRLVTG